MKRTLEEIAQHVGGRLLQPQSAAIAITGVASVGAAGPGDLVFVNDARHLQAALASAAAAIVTGDFAANAVGKPMVIAAQPKLAFTRAARLLLPRVATPPGVHPSAVVDPGASVGEGCSIGPLTVIGEGASIGARTAIAERVSIGRGVRIGSDCRIYPGVTLYPGTRLGNGVVVHAGAVLGSDGFGYVRDAQTGRYEQFPQVGTLEVGDDVEIGANCTVDRGALEVTVIGRGVKLDNMVHVGHNARIGEDVVIAAQTGISGSAVIGEQAIIAGQVGIADHVTIGPGVIIGAQCGVITSKVIRGPGQVFWGTPARPIRAYLKGLAVLARLARKS